MSETSSLYEKKFISIDGMTCGACSSCIEKLFRRMDGVESGTVSLMLKRAEVIFNPNVISLDDIIEEIEDVGFVASELKISATNTNIFSIQLFYSPIETSQQDIYDSIRSIEGVLELSISSDTDSLPNNAMVVDMSLSQAQQATNKGESMFFSITYDPKICGMRTITDQIAYECKILHDASDICSRKANIQKSRDLEISEWTQLFKYCLIFSVPAFCATMIFPLFSGFDEVFDTEFVNGCSIHDAILFLLATPIQFGPPGILFYRGAIKSLRAGSANMDVLVALATSISYFFSLLQIIICIIEHNASPNTTFETSAVLITVIILGKYMETIAKGPSQY